MMSLDWWWINQWRFDVYIADDDLLLIFWAGQMESDVIEAEVIMSLHV